MYRVGLETYLEIAVSLSKIFFFSLPIFNGKRGKYGREIKARGAIHKRIEEFSFGFVYRWLWIGSVPLSAFNFIKLFDFYEFRNL